MGRTRYKTIGNGKTYFTSSAVLNWLPLFAKPEIAGIILDSMRFVHTEKRIRIHAYIIMENHIHLLGTSENFTGEMRKFKSFTARSIVDYMKENGPKLFLDQLHFFKKAHKRHQCYQVWQEGFAPKLIQNEAMLNQKLEYIHYNPVKRGYIDKPEHWRYSSCRNYLFGEGLIEIEKLVG